jgi:hypothetical protein
VTVPEAGIIPDDDFEGGDFGANSEVDQAIAAGKEVQAASRAAAGKPSSPSAVSVFAWMVVLPLAVIAAAFGALRMRRRRRYSPAATTSST